MGDLTLPTTRHALRVQPLEAPSPSILRDCQKQGTHPTRGKALHAQWDQPPIPPVTPGTESNLAQFLAVSNAFPTVNSVILHPGILLKDVLPHLHLNFERKHLPHPQTTSTNHHHRAGALESFTSHTRAQECTCIQARVSLGLFIHLMFTFSHYPVIFSFIKAENLINHTVPKFGF